MESLNWTPCGLKSKTIFLFDKTSVFGIPGLIVNSIASATKRFAASRPQSQKSSPYRLWPLLALNFFMADMQSGIGPFIGVFLLERGTAT
jgi:hypothetical protein